MENEPGSVGRGVALHRDWTKGSVIGNLLSLSWPVILSETLSLVMLVDILWVAKLGAASIAGVGIARTVGFLLMSGRWGLITANRAMIARFVGAGDNRGATHVAIQAFVTCAIYVLVMAAVGISLAESILRLFGVEAAVVSEGAAYMRIMFLEMVAMTFWQMTESTMQASGDTMTPMKITVLFRLFHLILCPFLVFGLWLFPRLGVRGVAITSLAAFSLGAFVGLWLLFIGKTRLRLTLKNFRFDWNIIWRMVKIGIPASVMAVQGNFGGLIFLRILAPFGTLAIAGQTLVGRIEMALHVPPHGIGAGAGVLVGQNLGARQPERAERSGWLAAAIAEGFLVIGSLATLLCAEGIMRIFSSEPGLVMLGSTFLRIAVVGYLMLGFTAALNQCISGAGDTLPSLLVGLVMIWLVQIPLAFFLPRLTDLGVYGVPWARAASWIVEAVAYIVYFRLGRWKRRRV